MIGTEWPLVSAEEMRALDRHTIEDLAVPGDLLMESAGRTVVDAILALIEGSGQRILVVCGAGNNGGDGFVIARHLHLLGISVDTVLLGDASRLKGDAASNLARLEALGIGLLEGDWDGKAYAIIVDAIFGTGLARAVEGATAEAIQKVNAARPEASVIAVDLPSGIHADTGQALGTCIQADFTITMGLPKPGLILEPGATHAGESFVARIGIADEAPGVEPSLSVWTRLGAGRRVPARPSHGHKGSFGHVLIVAGSEGKTGAAALAAQGAGRAGTGLVTIACAASLNPILERKCTEVMTAPVAECEGGSLAESAYDAIVDLAKSRDVLAIGPGLGTHPETVNLVRRLVENIGIPMVIDADGLNALGTNLGVLKRRDAPTILTPHPGEAGRMLGLDAKILNVDRVNAARRLAYESGSVVVLKGAATVIAEPGGPETRGRAIINPTGGPYLATGGTGDVLTGVVAALLAQGLNEMDAAALAVYVHGCAADRLAGEIGASGVMAGDLLGAIPEVTQELRMEAHAAVERKFIGDGLLVSFPEP